MEYTEIRKWVEENDEQGDFTLDELDHISQCMHHFSRWYHEDYPLGGFLTAVIRNDFCGAIFQADDVNQRALKLYALFLTWNLPGDWRQKALAHNELRREGK